MTYPNNEDYGQEFYDFSTAYLASQNPRHMDEDTFHESPEEEEDATSYGTDDRNYDEPYQTEETDDEDFDQDDDDTDLEEEDLNDDFTHNSFDREDFDTE